MPSPRLKLGLTLALALTACTHHPPALPFRRALPLPQHLQDYYARPGGPTVVAPYAEGDAPSEYIRTSYTRHVYRLQYQSAGQPQDIRFEHYRPERPPDDPMPAVVVSEFLAGRIPEFVARLFTDEGWQVLVLRWPEDLLAAEKDAAALEETFRQIIIGARLCIDWLCRQPGVDDARLGSLGLSFGGMANVVLAAVDRDASGSPRLKYNAVAIAGEDLPAILRQTSEPRVLRYLEEHAAATGQDRDDVADELELFFRSDPKHLAPYVDSSRVLMFLSAFDTVVPIEQGYQLWESLGQPELFLAPTGHYTFALTHFPVPWFGTLLQRHFRDRFQAMAEVPAVSAGRPFP